MKLIYVFDDSFDSFEYEIADWEVRSKAIEYYTKIYSTENYNCAPLIEQLIDDELLAFENDEDFVEFLAAEFAQDAGEQYEDYREYLKDQHSYYGVNRDDFC